MPRTIGILGEIYSKDEVQQIIDEYETKLAALRMENERLQNSFPAAPPVQSTEQSSQSQELSGGGGESPSVRLEKDGGPATAEAIVLEISLEDSEAWPAKTGRVLRTRQARETRTEAATGKTASMAAKKRKKFACPDCEKLYVSKDSVKRHQLDVHGPRVFCQHCGHSTTQDRAYTKKF